MLYIIYLCVNIHIYLFIHLSKFFFYYCALSMYILWNDFMCTLLYMIMCMILSATSTHFKWELMLYCLHYPTLNKLFLLLLLLLYGIAVIEISVTIFGTFWVALHTRNKSCIDYEHCGFMMPCGVA